MKKYRKVLIVIVLLVLIILASIIYSSITKASSINIKDKVNSEIKYIESKFISIFNSLNNIEFENYKISVEDISEKSKKLSETTTTAGGQNNDTSEGGGGQEKSEASENELNKTKKYSLNIKGVLNSGDKINWDYIKNDAEMLQSSLSTITLDLYEIGVTSEDVINFTKEYDTLLIQIKHEDKENTLKELAILYSYLSKFINTSSDDEQYKIAVNTKQNIFYAYSLLDSENWELIDDYLQEANQTFSKLLTNINSNNKSNYIINKSYISLNSLQNSLEKKDKEIFLIKYKNLLEDLNNL